MRHRLSHPYVAATVAVALLVVGGSVAIAAGAIVARTPKYVIACFNSSHDIVPPTKGACAPPLTKVLLPTSVERGPRGPRGIPGTNGTDGTNGTNGTNGAPGTARAWAQVDASGTIVRSSNVTSVSLILTGDYCVHIAPAAFSSNDAATVSPNFLS